jgi:hypothetical protein
VDAPRVDANLDAAIVSFNVALRSKLLIGPISYNLADNPRYSDAFSGHHWSPAERKRQRAERRLARDGRSGSALSKTSAVRVSAAQPEVDSSEEEGAAPLPLVVCTTPPCYTTESAFLLALLAIKRVTSDTSACLGKVTNAQP